MKPMAQRILFKVGLLVLMTVIIFFITQLVKDYRFDQEWKYDTLHQDINNTVTRSCKTPADTTKIDTIVK